ncbi:MAG TPA: ABC transporter ATP-binding protein [Bacillota bacterium]|nr:ABC transporter ATP-binding protein [Bacillota bacterium]
MTDVIMNAILETQGLSKRFGGLYAVKNVDMSIMPGRIHGLIGPNGSGKSTFINVVTGVYTPTAGRIVFKNEELPNERAFVRMGRGIARTFQTARLFHDLSVLQNVMVGAHCRMSCGIAQVLLRTKGMVREETQLQERAEYWLDFVGYDGQIHRKAKELALVPRRLVEIARALISEPEVLFLDEPAAGMNSEEKLRLMELIRRIGELGIAVVAVEHDMKVIMGICDVITVLNFGTKIAEGTPTEIQMNQAVVEAYLGEVDKHA